MFFLQIKRAILTDEIYCPPEICVLLASYAMQVKYGDYEPERYRVGTISNASLLPQRVIEQYRLSESEWETRIINWWKEHEGLLE
jgi:hypothetical protein